MRSRLSAVPLLAFVVIVTLLPLMPIVCEGGSFGGRLAESLESGISRTYDYIAMFEGMQLISIYLSTSQSIRGRQRACAGGDGRVRRRSPSRSGVFFAGKRKRKAKSWTVCCPWYRINMRQFYIASRHSRTSRESSVAAGLAHEKWDSRHPPSHRLRL